MRRKFGTKVVEVIMVFDFSTRLNDVVNPFVTFGLNKIDYTIVKLDFVDVAKLGNLLH